jgi:ATP-dependent DNA ligase
MRFNAIVRGSKVEFRSRNGKEIDLKGNLEQDFIQLAKGKDLVFDGELVVKDKGKILDRQTGNGILNKAVKGTISSNEAELVCATIWDLIDYADFTKGKSTDTYNVRFNKLKAMAMKPLPNRIDLVEYQMVENAADAYATFTFYHEQGQEGIILKDLTGIWEDKRAKHQIKFKGELECDLRIVGIIEGTGKYQGMIGAIQCESEDGIIKVDVGSGFDDEGRKAKDVVGKIAAIKYNTRIKNRQGGESLFLPILLEIREDKTTADTEDKIK